MAQQSLVLYSHPLMESVREGVLSHADAIEVTIMKGDIIWEHFADKWPNLFIKDVKTNCVGRDVVFLGTLHTPEVIFEQISVLYALPRYMSCSVTFILPYFPTATMERVETEGKIATASSMARILSAIPFSSRGPCQIVIFDIHALQERFYFGDNVIPRLVSAVPLLLTEIVKRKMTNVSITFPDDGAFKRFHGMFDSYPFITCKKVRDGEKRVVKIMDGEASQRHCVIIDDLVMTGGTIFECAKVLKENGAHSVSAFVTHAVFPSESWKTFVEHSDLFENFFITDTIPHASEIAKHRPFKLLSIATIVSDLLLEEREI